MALPPVIVTTLCPICQGEGKILSKNCRNCRASGYIHSELIQRPG